MIPIYFDMISIYFQLISVYFHIDFNLLKKKGKIEKMFERNKTKTQYCTPEDKIKMFKICNLSKNDND